MKLLFFINKCEISPSNLAACWQHFLTLYVPTFVKKIEIKMAITMDKHKLTRWNLGRVYNSSIRHTCICCAIASITKRPNSKRKTRPKQLSGSLPLAFFAPRHNSTTINLKEKVSQDLKSLKKFSYFLSFERGNFSFHKFGLRFHRLDKGLLPIASGGSLVIRALGLISLSLKSLSIWIKLR